MLSGLVAVIALVALSGAVVALLRERRLRESLQDAHRRLYLAQARLNELENTVQKEVRSLRADVKRQPGAVGFDPTMRIGDAIANDPRVRDVFAQFHLGGCSACAVNEEETIEQAAMRYGVPLEQLLAALETLSNEPQPPQRAHRHSSLLQLDEF